MTTENLFEHYSDNTSLSEGNYDYLVDKENFKEALIKFAKHHVELALKTVNKSQPFPKTVCEIPYLLEQYKKIILNCYPLENIK